MSLACVLNWWFGGDRSMRSIDAILIFDFMCLLSCVSVWFVILISSIIFIVVTRLPSLISFPVLNECLDQCWQAIYAPHAFKTIIAYFPIDMESRNVCRCKPLINVKVDRWTRYDVVILYGNSDPPAISNFESDNGIENSGAQRSCSQTPILSSCPFVRTRCFSVQCIEHIYK